MRIIRENAVAVIVDVQERLLPHIDDNTALTSNLITLVKGLNILGVPVKITEQYKKGLGETIPSLRELLPGSWETEKLAFSCCDEPAFVQELGSHTQQTVILAGIEAHICVMQTAIDLKALGYKPVVVADCVGSRVAANKAIAINRMLHEGITVTSCESLLFELCRFAGTDSFKAISKLVK